MFSREKTGRSVDCLIWKDLCAASLTLPDLSVAVTERT